MTLSMYQASAPIYRQMLGSLSVVLGKAAAHAEARKIDPPALLQARLYPDMLPLTRQVQIASDAAKAGMARLAGEVAPRMPDVETSFAELQARIAATLAYVDGFQPSALDGSEERTIEVKLPSMTLTFSGQAFLTSWSLPNFFFHVTTAYDILRHNGVEIGKRDFMGKIAA